jgi:ABC-type polysaccharide/polyol phosphate export permease
LNAVLAMLRLDLQHVRRSRSDIVWMAIMPFAFMAFFGNVFRAPDPDPQTKRVTLGLLDEDRSEISRALAASFDSTRYRILDASVDSLVASPPVRTLVIPSGLERAVLANETADVMLRGSGGDSEYLLAAQAGLVRALVRVHGALALVGPGSTWADTTREAFRAAVARPARVRVRSEWAGRVQIPGGYGQSVPGNLVTFLLMSTVIQSAILLTNERTSGILRRISSQPVSRASIFFGTFLARLGVALAQLALMVAGAHVLFGFRIGGSLVAFAVVGIAFSGTCVAFGIWLGTRFESVRQAAMTAWISALLMAAVGGAWWPLEIVPSWMRTFAHAFPTAWAMDGFHAVTSYGGGIAEVALPLAVLAGMSVVLFAGAVRSLRPL